MIPILNNEIEGWKKAVLSGAEKSAWTEDFVQKNCAPLEEKIVFEKNEARFPRAEFDSLFYSQKLFVLHALLKKCEFSGRFPHKILKNFVLLPNEKNFSSQYDDFFLTAEKDFVCAKKNQDEIFESGFSVLVKNDCNFCVCDIFFEYANEFLSANGKKLLRVSSPFVVRSLQNCDKIESSDGKLRSVSKILCAWKTEKNSIPLVEILPSQKIVAILGSPFGFKNWILKEFCVSDD